VTAPAGGSVPGEVDQLAGIAEGVREQTRALEEQREAIVALDARVAALQQVVERQGTGTGLDRAEVLESLDKLRGSLKAMRGTEKRAMARLNALLSRVSVSLDPSVDSRFCEVAEPLVHGRRTMLDYDRLFTLWEAARNVASIGGHAAEIGTFRGGSAALLAQALHSFAAAPHQVHVVDTFEGHLDDTFSQHDDPVQRGKFQETRFEDVKAFLSGYPGTHVHMGNGPLVVATWPERTYCLVHLDVDLYQPTIDCLAYFGRRMAAGGVIVVDDYGAPSCPGIAVAVHEYVGRNAGFQVWRMRAEQIVLLKR
jgi:hypothetical protein